MVGLYPNEETTPPWLGLAAALFALFLGVSAGAAGYLVVAQRPPSFLSSAAVLLDQPTAIAAAQDSGIVDKLSRLRFKYAAVLRSDAVVNPVAAELGLAPGVVAANIVSRGDTASLLLFVGGRSDSRAGAVRLANALASQLGRYVHKEQLDTGLGPEQRLSLRVVAPARGASQLLPTLRQKGVTAVGTGLAAAAGVLGVFGLLRRRI